MEVFTKNVYPAVGGPEKVAGNNNARCLDIR